MSDTKQLDDQLAEFTDRLLSNEPAVFPDELQAEAQLLRSLKTVIAPQETIDPIFQQRLTRKLEKEWRVKHHRSSWWHYLRIDRIPPPRQLAAVATLVILAFILVLISIPGSDLTGDEAIGTAAGGTPTQLVFIVIINTALVAIAGLAFWLWRNKK